MLCVFSGRDLFCEGRRTTEVTNKINSGGDMNRNTKLIVLVFAITFFGIAFIFYRFATTAFEGRKGTPSLEKLESLSGIKFPRGTRLSKGYYEGFLDPQYLAVLDFDARDTESFIKSIPREKNKYGETLVSRTDRLSITNGWPDINRDKSHSWWDPDSVHKFVAVDIQRDGSPHVYLLISLDDATRTRMYLYIVTT